MRARPLILASAALAVAVVLFLVLQDNGDEGSPAPAPSRSTAAPDEPGDGEAPLIRFESGEVVGGTAEIVSELGERVRFAVEADVDGEVHVHGFERLYDVQAGEVERISFPAEFDGIVEVELHWHSGGAEQESRLAELTVNP